MMTFLIIYLVLALIWAIFAGYKNYQLAKINQSTHENWRFVEGFIINLVLFPIALLIWLIEPSRSSCSCKCKDEKDN